MVYCTCKCPHVTQQLPSEVSTRSSVHCTCLCSYKLARQASEINLNFRRTVLSILLIKMFNTILGLAEMIFGLATC